MVAGDEVLWLPDIHPKSFEDLSIELTFIGHFREDFSLNGSRFRLYNVYESVGKRLGYLNATDNFLVEDVQSSIDFIADELLWFLDESLNFSVWISDNYTVLRRFFDLSEHNSSFFSMGFVEIDELLEWEFADDVAVQNKKQAVIIIFLEDFLGELDRTSYYMNSVIFSGQKSMLIVTSSERLNLLRACNFDFVLLEVRPSTSFRKLYLLFEFFDVFHHGLWLVGDSQDDFSDTDLQCVNLKFYKMSYFG